MKVLFPDRKQELFEASKVLDDADSQIIEAKFNGQPFFFTIGRAKHHSKDTGGEASATTAQVDLGKGAEKEFDWTFLFSPRIIPGFMQIDQFRALAVLMTSVSSTNKIEADHATFTPTTSYGGADVRWELTQTITKYLSSIECTSFALDEGPEVEYSTSAPVVLVYFSLKNVSHKKMRISSMTLNIVYTELESSEGGLCGAVINQIEFDLEKPAADLNRDVEILEKKLRTEFAGVLKDFVKKNMKRPS